MKAFELADVEGLKRLLTQDVLMEMPPMLNWFSGRSNYGLFMEWVFGAAGKDWLLKEVAANGGQPGFAAYRRVGGGYELHTLQIFTVTAGGISRNSVFQSPEVFAAFGLPAGLDAQGLHRRRAIHMGDDGSLSLLAIVLLAQFCHALHRCS
jgi:RNA polymerase sigma-70 factor, ECF subfamily